METSNHENLIQLTEFIEDEFHIYLVMPLAEKSLFMFIQTYKKIVQGEVDAKYNIQEDKILEISY